MDNKTCSSDVGTLKVENKDSCSKEWHLNSVIASSFVLNKIKIKQNFRINEKF